MTAIEIEALIIDHMPLVERIARGVAKRMPPWIELDELVSVGNIGLVQAANRYDANLHPNFEYYAYFRIRGSMIEAYRGRNYPRLMDQIPDAWLGIEDPATSNCRAGRDVEIPECLIDPSSPEEAMIQYQEEHRAVVCITKARRELPADDGRVLDLYLSGKSMRKLGKEEGRHAAWAHQTIHRAKKKLRASYEVLDGGKKAA